MSTIKEGYYSNEEDKAIILLHSYTSSNKDVQSLARYLNREGYAVYTPNLSGHSDTVDLEEILNYGVDDWKIDIDNAIEFMMSEGYSKISIFGLSLGGIMSLNTLVSDDRVFAGGAFSASLYLNDLTGIKRYFFYLYNNQMKNRSEDKEDLKVIGKKLDQVFAGVKDMSSKTLTKIESFNKPIFLAQGGKDEIVEAQEVVTFRNNLNRNQIHFHWYDDAPHVLTIGSVGVKLREDLLAFLSTLDW